MDQKWWQQTPTRSIRAASAALAEGIQVRVWEHRLREQKCRKSLPNRVTGSHQWVEKLDTERRLMGRAKEEYVAERNELVNKR